MEDETEFLFNNGNMMSLVKNNSTFVLACFNDNDDRLAQTFFNSTNELGQGDIELENDGLVVGLVGEEAPDRLLEELREV